MPRAQRMARAGPSKAATNPSPVVFSSRPRARASSLRMAASCASTSFRTSLVAQLGGLLGRADDVREHHRGEHAIDVRLGLGARAGQKFLNLVQQVLVAAFVRADVKVARQLDQSRARDVVG
jgi:hypothetical protein